MELNHHLCYSDMIFRCSGTDTMFMNWTWLVNLITSSAATDTQKKKKSMSNHTSIWHKFEAAGHEVPTVDPQWLYSAHTFFLPPYQHTFDMYNSSVGSPQAEWLHLHQIVLINSYHLMAMISAINNTSRRPSLWDSIQKCDHQVTTLFRCLILAPQSLIILDNI